MKKHLLFAAFLLSVLPCVAMGQYAQRPISNWPVPTTGSPNLSAGDVTVGNRGGVTYQFVVGFGGSCLTHNFVNSINPQGVPVCVQPAFSDLSGFLTLSQLGGLYTNGQLLIGNTSTGQLQAATLSAGNNISITNAGGSITISASSISSGVSLGTSTSAANPQISGDATSGIYTPGAAQVGVVISGTQRGLFNTSGETVTGVLTASAGVTNQGAMRGKITAVADAAYTVLSSDYEIAYTSISAARVVSIACASLGSSTSPQYFIIKDQSGSAGVTNTITLTATSGTIDNASTKVISTAYGLLRVYANGSNCYQW